MVSDLSLDVKVSSLASKLKDTLTVANAVAEEGGFVDEIYADAAHRFILAYHSGVSNPRVPDYEFRTHCSLLSEWAGRNSAFVKHARGEPVGCLYFVFERLFGWLLPAKPDNNEFFDDSVYVKAFEKLRDESVVYVK